VACEGTYHITQQAFYRMRDAGINNIRIPFIWVGRVGPAPDYKVDSEWLDRLEEVISYAEKADMIVYFDMHNDCPYNRYEDMPPVWVNLYKASTDPAAMEEYTKQLHALWTQVARRFRDKGDFLMFESFNEPESGDGFYWGWHTPEEMESKRAEIECIDKWNQTFVDAIRSTGGNNAKRWLIISGPGGKARNLPYITIPHDYVSNNRLMVSAHVYEPENYVFGLMPEWGWTAREVNSEILQFDESFIEKQFKDLRENYMDKGIPICVNEVGCANRETEREKAYQLYYWEFLTRAASLNGMMVSHFDGGRNAYEYSPKTLFIFDYETGDYLGYGEEIINLMKKAAFSNDPAYTLQSIKDRAPFKDQTDTSYVSIPDPVFRQYLLETYDRDGDGKLSYHESLFIDIIEVETDGIYSLEDNNRFFNLKRLVAEGSESGRGQLTKLDLSNNTKLEELSFLNNAVSELNLSGCNDLRTITCWSNQLKSLDITQHPKLELLACAQNQITSLDFSHCPHLREVAVNDNLLTSLDVTCLPNLEILECGGNPIKELDVSKCPNLKQLITTNSPILTKIILAEGQKIDYLAKDEHTVLEYKSGIAIGDDEFEKYLLEHFDQNQDGIISLSEAAEIRDVEVSTDNISTIQALQHAGSLTRLVANGTWPKQGQLTRLDVSHNPLLEHLVFLENNVAALNINGCTKLVEITCWGNNLSELDVTNCPDLEMLFCAQNHLTSIDISKCPKLRAFAPNDNDLEELDLSNNPLLDEVEINGNPHLKVVWLKKGQTIKHFIRDGQTEIRYKD